MNHRRLVLLGLLPTTLYLSAADALAISSGTWTISPPLSLGIYIGGVLPVEELLFFLSDEHFSFIRYGVSLAQASQRRLQDPVKIRLSPRLPLSRQG